MLSMLQRAKAKALQRRYRPRIEVVPGESLRRLGSAYGGWTFEDRAELADGTIVSCGLGEDASFDVEIASAYGARLILVDPTPRAIAHFDAVVARLGSPAVRDYVAGGEQPVEAYDLTRLNRKSLELMPVALWIENTTLRFYEPENPEHVSHSITFQPEDGSRYIEVPALTYDEVVARAGTEEIALLKLDIEGAETQVLAQVADWSVKPQQILVEFDVLRDPGEQSRGEVERIDRILRDAGFTCRHFDGDRNYLYVLA